MTKQSIHIVTRAEKACHAAAALRDYCEDIQRAAEEAFSVAVEIIEALQESYPQLSDALTH